MKNVIETNMLKYSISSFPILQFDFAPKKCFALLFQSVVIPQDTSASTYEIFETRAVDRAILCFEIREIYKIRASGLAGQPAAHDPVSRASVSVLVASLSKKHL